ncbi:dienelactone hydrolase endo-1,3,1,4-beta-D-glucanase [Amanita muscaria]
MSCPDCFKGGLLPGEPTGVSWFFLMYFTPSPSGGPSNPSKRAVLLFTDVCGLGYPNPKIIADILAQRLDCDVWIPDYFNGNPIFKPESLAAPLPAGIKLTWGDWWKFGTMFLSRAFVLYINRSSFIPALLQEKKYEKVGAVGYCFGGSQCVFIAPSGLVHSLVICHPGPFGLDEGKAINIPTSWVCAEDDFFFNESKHDQAEAIFAARKDRSDYVPYEFVLYKGVKHGFACRPDLSYPIIKEAYEKSLEQTVAWFEKTLLV